jgi:hypothetical protein
MMETKTWKMMKDGVTMTMMEKMIKLTLMTQPGKSERAQLK